MPNKEIECLGKGWLRVACGKFRQMGMGDCLAEWMRSGNHGDSMASHNEEGNFFSGEQDVTANARKLPDCMGNQKSE